MRKKNWQFKFQFLSFGLILATSTQQPWYGCTIPYCKTHTGFSNPRLIHVGGKCYCWSHEQVIDNESPKTNRLKTIERCKSQNAKLTLPKNKLELKSFSRVFGKKFGSKWYVWLDMTNPNKEGRASIFTFLKTPNGPLRLIVFILSNTF